MERILWSVIFMVISSGWNPPESMVLPSSHIFAAAVSSPAAMDVSSTHSNSVKETIPGKYNNPGKGRIHPLPMSDVKAVAGQSLQLLCPIVLGSVQEEDIAQEPIYWMKGKLGTFLYFSYSPCIILFTAIYKYTHWV